MSLLLPKVKILHHSGFNYTFQFLYSTDFALIYQAFHGDTEYILKYIPFSITIQEKFINEVTLLIRASELEIAPNINDVWTTQKGGIIIMEKLDNTIGDFLIDHVSLADKHLILTNVLIIIDKLHLYGIYHGDLNLGNIMVKLVSGTENQKYSENKYKYYLIDFGESGTFTNVLDPNVLNDWKIFNGSILDLVNDFYDENFKNILDTINIYIQRFY